MQYNLNQLAKCANPNNKQELYIYGYGSPMGREGPVLIPVLALLALYLFFFSFSTPIPIISGAGFAGFKWVLVFYQSYLGGVS